MMVSRNFEKTARYGAGLHSLNISEARSGFASIHTLKIVNEVPYSNAIDYNDDRYCG